MEKFFIRKDNNVSNKCSAECMRFMSVLSLFVWIANQIGLFTIDKSVMLMLLVFNIILLFLPTFIINVLNINDPFLGYIIILCCGIFSCSLYIVLADYAVLLFIYPLIMALIYFDKRIITFSIAVSILSVISAQLIIEHINIKAVVNVYYNAGYKLFLYDIMPKVLDIIFLGICSISLVNRRYKSGKKMLMKTKDTEKRNECLKTLSANSKYLFCSKNLYELMDAGIELADSVIHITESEIKLKARVSAFKNRNGKYNVVKTKERVSREFDTFVIEDGSEENNSFQFDSRGDMLEVSDKHILMRFFLEDEFFGFVYISGSFEKCDSLTEFMDILHTNIQISFENLYNSTQLLQTQEDIIYTFASICESKLNHSEHHIKRVSEYVRIMASGLGFSDEFCDNMRLASMMHDIGMLLVPTEVFEKPGLITYGEHEIIKNHVEYGADILSNSSKEVMKIARFMAKEHHERWDGSGYLGMCGDEISVYGRVIAVADVFDTLMSEKIYKKAWNAAEAFEEIINKSGTWFDPKVVKVFEDNFSEFLKVAKKYPDLG